MNRSAYRRTEVKEQHELNRPGSAYRRVATNSGLRGQLQIGTFFVS